MAASRKSSANRSTNENTMISKIIKENSCPQKSMASNECPESEKKMFEYRTKQMEEIIFNLYTLKILSKLFKF